MYIRQIIVILFLSVIIWALIPGNNFLYAASYTIEGDVIGELTLYKVGEEETLYQIARKFDIGIVELLAANPGIDPWVPKEGTELLLPTAYVLPSMRKGIVINLSELRLFYFPDEKHVITFPVGIGREGWQTPPGTTKVLRKRVHPIWTPPPSIRAENPDLPEMISPGSENPLGDYAFDLGWTGYLIHATNRPYGVGKRSSHGCIRLYPEDMAVLFDAVSEGAIVTVIDTPYQLGWQEDKLIMTVMPEETQADVIAEYRIPQPIDIPDIYDAVWKKGGEKTDINWYAVDEAAKKRNLIPVVIGEKKPLF